MKKFFALMTCISMMVCMAAVTSVHAAEGAAPFLVNGSSYETLDAALTAANASRDGVITLTDNATVTSGVTISGRKAITLNLANYTLNVSNDYSGNLFYVESKLIITGDERGVIDLTTSENSQKAVENIGDFTLKGGTIKSTGDHLTSGVSNAGVAKFEANAKMEGFATNILTTAEGTTSITGGTYLNNYFANVDNLGTTTITGGTFTNTSCSSCNPNWGYTIRSRAGHMEIDGANVEVYGVQGALAIVNGTANIRSGHFETLPCSVHNSGESSFYALYVAGEVGETTAHIYGGTFISCTKTAALIGNKGDGGLNLNSNCYIHGGTFTTNGAIGVPIISADVNGNPFIDGGMFSKEVNTEFLDEGCIQNLDETTGYYVVSKL